VRPADVVSGTRAAAARVLVDVSRLVVMTSGGRDSVCLLDVAVTLLGAEQVHALHVNYGLRAGADDDEHHCAGLCAQLGVDLHVVRAERPGEGRGNLQAWARDVRYGAATRRALELEAMVASGHTASDQAETVLYRLAASPGRRALLGMSPRDGRLLRPLLAVSRRDTGAYCRARNLDWREDPDNDSDRWARGRVRHGLLPALRRVHPAAEANVLRTATLLRDEAAVLDEVVSTALAGRDRIALERLAELPDALARLVVVRLAEHAAGEGLPAAGGRVRELLELAGRGGSTSLDLGGGVRAVVEYGVLRMSGTGDEPEPEAVALAVGGRAQFGRWEVCCEVSGAGTREPACAVLLDAEKVRGGLRVRAWRAGDRMAPPGVHGTRTLADLFTDRKLARAQRHSHPVVEVEGAIVWVPLIAADRRFLAAVGTSDVLRLSALRHPTGDPDRVGAGPAGEGGEGALGTRLDCAPTTGRTGRSPPALPDRAAMPEPAISSPGPCAAPTADPAIGDILVGPEDLLARVRALAQEISRDYAGRPLLLVGVLKGAVFFLSDLMRFIDIPVEVDFMAVASYGSATDSSGVVRILKDLDVAIEGRDVLIVEDIVDSGLTLQYLLRNLGSRNPGSLEVCALLTKPERRKVALPTRYVGFEIPNRFVIGYGLDHGERYRNLPYVAALNT